MCLEGLLGGDPWKVGDYILRRIAGCCMDGVTWLGSLLGVQLQGQHYVLSKTFYSGCML